MGLHQPESSLSDFMFLARQEKQPIFTYKNKQIIIKGEVTFPLSTLGEHFLILHSENKKAADSENQSNFFLIKSAITQSSCDGFMRIDATLPLD